MKTLSPNLRTAEQNRKLWWLAGKLGIDRDTMDEIVISHTNGRTSHSSELSFLEARELIDFLHRTLFPRGSRESSSAKTDKLMPHNPEWVKLDRKRKGVIKAIFRWFELRGQYPTMEYVKSVACRAAKKDSFNDISLGELTRIYAEFCRKQETVGAMAGVMEQLAVSN